MKTDLVALRRARFISWLHGDSREAGSTSCGSDREGDEGYSYAEPFKGQRRARPFFTPSAETPRGHGGVKPRDKFANSSLSRGELGYYSFTQQEFRNKTEAGTKRGNAPSSMMLSSHDATSHTRYTFFDVFSNKRSIKADQFSMENRPRASARF